MAENELSSPIDEYRMRREAIFIGIVVAILWWIVAMYLYKNPVGVLVWYDQEHIFRNAPLATPYDAYGFVHPIWVVVLSYPFRWFPLEIGTLLQSLIYFVALALVIVKFGGDRRAILLTLFSFPSLDAVLQMNVDWLVIVGMLLPVWISGPFILAKPQIGIGYYLGQQPRDLLKAAVLMMVVFTVTVLIWGWWPEIIIGRVQNASISRFFNIAPVHYLGVVSILISIVLGIIAFIRKDVPLGVLAGLFFTPYISAYSLPLMLGMVAIRSRRLAFVITISYWIVMGILIGNLMLQNG